MNKLEEETIETIQVKSTEEERLEKEGSGESQS